MNNAIYFLHAQALLPPSSIAGQLQYARAHYKAYPIWYSYV